MKIFNIDALKLLKKIPDNSIDLIYTDPPYFIQEEVSVIRRGNSMKYKAKSNIDFKKNTEWDRVWKNQKEYLEWIKELLTEMKRVLKEDRHIIMWFDKRRISYLWDIAEELGMKGRTSLMWKKTNPVPQARGVSPAKSVEMAMWITNGKSKQEFYNYKLGLIHDLIEAPIPAKQGGLTRHPTQKPLKVVLFHILYFSKPNDIVLDPFAGSGTTGVAAALIGRRYILGELNKEYVENIKYRLNNLQDKSILRELNKVKEYIYEHRTKIITDEELSYLLGEKQILHT